MATPSLPPVLPGLEHVRLLGSGGFADVHLYRQELPRMLVAVKVLRGTTGADQRRQLVDEANAMAELAEHPYIVTIFRAGTTDDGRPYLVMAYLPQPNLAARARANPLSVAEALRTGIQLASAVETAHRAGVLHRDIKPANVLVSSYGTPALADFGIAGRAETVHEDDEIGVSVAWAPPEVLLGHSNGSVAADVYSLTATLSYLLTGRTPFEDTGGDNSERALMARTTREAPRRTGRADVPESLERLLQHGLAKDPAQRPRSALALAMDLQHVEQELRLPRTEVVVLDHDDEGLVTVTGTPTTVRSALPAPVERTPELPPTPATSGATAAPGPARRWPMALVGALVAAVLVALGVVGGLLLTRDRGSGEVGSGTSSSSEVPSSTTSEPPTTSAGTTPSSSSSSPSSAARTGELDPCLVGSWRTVSHEERSPFGVITDLERTMTFTDSGRLTITYDKAEAKGAGEGWVFDGTVEYDVTTRDGTMSFDLVRNDLELTINGSPAPASPGVKDVSYTCSGDTFTESSAVMDARFERSS